MKIYSKWTLIKYKSCIFYNNDGIIQIIEKRIYVAKLESCTNRNETWHRYRGYNFTNCKPHFMAFQWHSKKQPLLHIIMYVCMYERMSLQYKAVLESSTRILFNMEKGKRNPIYF